MGPAHIDSIHTDVLVWFVLSRHCSKTKTACDYSQPTSPQKVVSWLWFGRKASFQILHPSTSVIGKLDGKRTRQRRRLRLPHNIERSCRRGSWIRRWRDFLVPNPTAPWNLKALLMEPTPFSAIMIALSTPCLRMTCIPSRFHLSDLPGHSPPLFLSKLIR